MNAEELFVATFAGDYDDDAPWEAVSALRLLGSDEVFELVAKYVRSDVAIQRARALDVLGQLGAGRKPAERLHFDESVAIAIQLLADGDRQVARSAAWALAHLGEGAAVATLIGLVNSDDADIRWAVAFGLFRSERDDATEALIRLTEDVEPQVRNWATFALGQAVIRDSAAVWEALRRRLADSFLEARHEAIWGLALRRDPEALRLLADRLDSEEWVAGDEIAAGEILGVSFETPPDDLRAGLRKLV